MLLTNIWDFIYKYDSQTEVLKIFGVTIDLGEFMLRILMVIVTIFIVFFILKIGNKIIDKLVAKQIYKNNLFSINDKKANTLGTLLKSMLRYTVYIMGIISIAGIIVGGTLPIAFASVGGVALGFGAQSFVKDIINGVFILFENQYNVGDYITIDKYTGIVDSIEIRSTTIKEFSGSYHIIPNGLINVVTNHSKGNMQIKVEVDIAYEESIDNAIKIIEDVCIAFSKLDDVERIPNEVGVTQLGSSGMTIKVLGDVKAMSQWKLEAKLRQMIKEALDKNSIEIPYNKLNIVSIKENIKEESVVEW